MGITTYILLAFIVGVILLIFGFVNSKNRKLKRILLIVGGILLVAAIALGLFLAFVLIPAM